MPCLRRLPSCLRLWGITLCSILLLGLASCEQNGNSMGHLDTVWGRRGNTAGRLQKPRCITIDSAEQLYLIDMTARIQVFDLDGNFIRQWETPTHENGRPTGISIDRQGRILVADTHYFRLLIYSPEGELLQTIGGTNGHGPGEFGFVTDAAQDSQGNYYISEYGEYDRIQKFSPKGEYLLEWGGHGTEPGQFARPQCLTIDEQDHIWVADACNHRIQVFDTQGHLIKSWGTSGSAPGELCYPYSLIFDAAGDIYICEYGNHRVQKFNRDGQSLGCWGGHGRGPGQMHNPWGIVLDSRGRLHVLDTNNHRVQRVLL